MTKPKTKDELELIELEDTLSHSQFKVPLRKDLEAMSDIRLAREELNGRGKVAETIFKNEWRRRDALTQHKLNEIIIEKQHQLNLEISRIQNKTVWKSAILAAVCTIVGAILGAMLVNTATNNESTSLSLHQQKQSKGIQEPTQQ